MPDSLLSASPSAAPPAPAPVVGTPRTFFDVPETRNRIYANVLGAAQALEPITDGRYTLNLTNPRYMDPPEFTRKAHKEALLTYTTLGRRLKGTWELADADGNLLDRREQVVARVPYLTHQGTFVRDGTDYMLRNQQRLRPGIYARRKESGELESHANLLSGEGASHRYTLDPDKGLFHIQLGQSHIPLMPLLNAMGATDNEVRAAWGPEVHAANALKANDVSAMAKLSARLLRKTDQTDEPGTQRQRIVEAFARMKLDPNVMESTLGKPFTGIDKHTILAATGKLLRISRGENEPGTNTKTEPDDRDALHYQTFLGPEDLFAERLRKDHGRVRRQLLFKIAQTGDLSKVPSGALTSQLDHPILYSGLGNSVEEINPAELLDKLSSVTRMGEGGIGSLTAIPADAREVHGSQFGFIDGTRTPESERAGVDVYFSHRARKGVDGQIHAPFQDVRTGQTVWRTPQDVAKLNIAFSGHEKWDAQRVPVLRGGKFNYVPRDQIDLAQTAFEDSFSPLGNMVPFKSAVKAQRVAMASRMASQALPLQDPEAPLVQSGMPGSGGARSFEEEYGKHLGAVHATGPGIVKAVTPDGIVIRKPDGTDENIELYNRHVYARKTFLHQTPLVKSGDRIEPGQLLAHSNYTDKKGVTALGINARVAYYPYLGLNHEDAVVISEGMAKRLTSEHAYQHDLEVDDKTRLGKRAYVSLFPGKFTKEDLAKLDHDGIIEVGQTVDYGQPLVVAAREREFAANKIHKKRQAGFNDQSILWEHHDRGIVTDVARGKNGPVVVVKASSQMQTGDKLCYDPDTKILTKDRGWLSVADVTKRDAVATLNPQTECLEWQRPTHVWTYDYTGDMYQLSTKHVDMLVTPEHKLWVAKRYGSYRAIAATELYASDARWQFKKDCKWMGEVQEWMKFPLAVGYRNDTQVLRKVAMNDWLEFLGYYVAEGSLNGNGHVRIGQSRSSPAWLAIGKVLRRLMLVHYYRDAGPSGYFEIGNVWLKELLEPLGNSYTKFVPDYVQKLPAEQIRVFFDAYMAGDGHKGKTWEYSSSSERLVYDVQLLCLKLGWSVTVKECTRTDNWSKARHWRGRVNRRHLRPWWWKSRTFYKSNKEAMVPYTGKVYCVTVPNHIIYVMRRDKTYWSLNSGRYG